MYIPCSVLCRMSGSVSHCVSLSMTSGGRFVWFKILLKSLLLILHANKLQCMQQRQYLDEWVSICGDLSRKRKMRKCHTDERELCIS